MSSTTATSPVTTVPSRIPVQPTPTFVTPRSRTPSSTSRTPRQSSSASSTQSTGRSLPVTGGGNVNRQSVGSNRATALQPLRESLPSNHRHSNVHKVCVAALHMFISVLGSC